MSDYIKREDAIVAYANHEVNVRQGKFEDYRQYMRNVLRSVESADVEEVVRCKDCLWFEIAVMKADGTPDKRYKADWCGLHRIVRDGDDYCSDGWKDEEID